MNPFKPQAVIIAGPNGSGKSTAATQLLHPEMTFVNADLIAQEITGEPGTSADINAGRLLIERLEDLLSNRQDFAFETTLASRMLSSRVAQWRESGYQVHLIYFYLPSDELCVMRVEGRVRDGGHAVPEETVRRRYRSGLRLFFTDYCRLVDTWRIYDNSALAEPSLIARGDIQDNLRILQPETWTKLKAEFGYE